MNIARDLMSLVCQQHEGDTKKEKVKRGRERKVEEGGGRERDRTSHKSTTFRPKFHHSVRRDSFRRKLTPRPTLEGVGGAVESEGGCVLCLRKRGGEREKRGEGRERGGRRGMCVCESERVRESR